MNSSAPIVLVPGFWLGAWAWDEVAAELRAEGHDVTAVTLPGLESLEADRSAITMADHVDAICAAVTAARVPVVLAVHSGAGIPGYGATDRIPEQIAAMVYVDSYPERGPANPDFSATELPLPPWEELEQDPGNSLEGLTAEQLDTFRQRAVPEPGAALREAPLLINDARRVVPSTLICAAVSSDQIKAMLDEGQEWVAGLTELNNVTFIDLPTSHWVMWSRPQELAKILGDIARAARSD